jgi:hypothetical protein
VINEERIGAVMPAYSAAETPEDTARALPETVGVINRVNDLCTFSRLKMVFLFGTAKRFDRITTGVESRTHPEVGEERDRNSYS